MFLWFIYLLVSFYISYVVVGYLPSKLKILFFVIVFILLTTPSTIEVGSTRLAPSLFVFIYDIFLERNFSLRSLRPILLSVPSSLILAPSTPLEPSKLIPGMFPLLVLLIVIIGVVDSTFILPLT